MPSSPKFTRKRFGQAVRRRRLDLGWSQEKFAERADIHRTYVSSVELGKVSVGIDVAHALAQALRMRLSELVRMAE